VVRRSADGVGAMERPVRVLLVAAPDDAATNLRRRARPAVVPIGPVALTDAGVSTLDHAPDVVLVAGEPTALAGALEQIRAADARVRILVVGDAETPGLAASVIGAGGCGVVPADAAPDVLREAVLRAAAGELVLDDRELRTLVDELASTRPARPAGVDALTAREREILRAIAEGRTTTEVGVAFGISAATVQSHVKSVLAKLGVHSKVEAVRIAWREGLAAVPA
jgi:DNA-binding NarL/FixJ family response regulator